MIAVTVAPDRRTAPSAHTDPKSKRLPTTCSSRRDRRRHRAVVDFLMPRRHLDPPCRHALSLRLDRELWKLLCLRKLCGVGGPGRQDGDDRVQDVVTQVLGYSTPPRGGIGSLRINDPELGARSRVHGGFADRRARGISALRLPAEARDPWDVGPGPGSNTEGQWQY